MEWTYDLAQIDEMASVFWETFPDKRIYAFQGQMAAGKTSFIRALCAAKNVKETVSSPTFSIINEYSYPGGILYHLDLYRLKDEQEALRAGVEDCLYSGSICLLEWPERASGILPRETLGIFLETLDENTRKITAPSIIGKNSG
jgi:tRNA threonylcarbamoyladenosine biosynthesis protein TsaE